MAGLEQRAAGAVRLPLRRIARLPSIAIGIDDIDALRDLAAGGARLANSKLRWR